MAATAPMSASQPQATDTLQSPVTINPEALRRLGVQFAAKFTTYEQDRRIAELKWTRNARQYLGVYDPEVDTEIDKNRSHAYPKLTRVKCVSMLSRLMNLLFPANEKNWSVDASKVPNLSQEDLQGVLDTLMPQGADPNSPPSDDQIESAIRKFARKRACRLELEIEDQLQELGGNRAQDYVALCRKVLNSGIQYGCGVLRGPFVSEETQRFWQMADGRLVANERTVHRPRFEFASIWDYYPDMSAKYFAQMDGQFLRIVMSRHQVNSLCQRADFMSDQIKEALRRFPNGNYKRRTYETELRALGSQINTASQEINKFEAYVWDGYIKGADLAQCGAQVPENKLDDDVRGQLWMIDNVVIKAKLDPWTRLLKDETVQMYHHFVFEEDESFLLGNGLPNIMRDSQMGLCAATRIMLDNASVQRVFEVNYGLLRMNEDVSTINPDMTIARDDDNPATAALPAIRPIELPLKIAEMQQMVQMFQGFADQETFVNAATGGDMQRGPSEPFRTAAGASMLRGDAALPFKDVVRNFDVFTESVIGSLIQFNRAFNPDANLQGDFTAVARGATSLIAKEVQGMQIDQIAQTLTDEEKQYLNSRELLRQRLKVRDLDYNDIVYDDEKCDQIDAQRAQAQQAAQAQQQRVVEAEIRKMLSDVLKNIAQAGKNAAGAQATTANVILAALEKGLNPDMLAPPTTHAGATPDGNDDGRPAAGAGAGAGAAPAGEDAAAGAGLASLEAAAGPAAQAPRPGAAAMPVH